MSAMTAFSLVMQPQLAEALDDIVLARNAKRVRPRATRASILREAAVSFVEAHGLTLATSLNDPSSHNKDA